MKYTKGNLVLVQTSHNTKLRKEYAIVQNTYFKAIKVKFMQTGEVRIYLKEFITLVTE